MWGMCHIVVLDSLIPIEVYMIKAISSDVIVLGSGVRQHVQKWEPFLMPLSWERERAKYINAIAMSHRLNLLYFLNINNSVYTITT